MMTGTYVTDITHYLDDQGEMAEMPGPARQLASFLVLLIDAVTQDIPAHDRDTRIRCRTPDCRGSIHATLLTVDSEIAWYCPICSHHGVIRKWQHTKWDHHQDA